MAAYERNKRKKKKKKQKKEKPKLKTTKSSPYSNSKSQIGHPPLGKPKSTNPTHMQSPIPINHSSSPHSVTPEAPMSGSYDNDYKERHTNTNEPEITEMDDDEDDDDDEYPQQQQQQHRFKTIVVDNGTSLMKVGYVGEQAPVAMFHPTQVSKGRKLQKNPIERGIIVDCNMIEAVYNNAFSNTLRIKRDDLSEYGVILNCAVFCPQDTAEQLCEIMMEGFGFSKFYICSSALLSLYGTQKVSGLVIESGSSLTQCVPIWNGCPVAQACKRVDVGGDDVDEYLRDLLRTNNKKKIGADDLTSAVCKKIKESHGYIALDYRKEKSKQIEYELPNGKRIKIGDERFKCGELLFSYLDRNSIDKQIYDSVMSCDVDIRKEMLSNIVISGGSTMFKGMQNRIATDLMASCKSSKTKKMKKYAKKVNVVAPQNRDVLSWCGGSIFGALPAFDQFWFTMEDYQEKGAILSQKIEHSNIFFYDDYEPKELDLKEIQNYNQQYRRRTLSVYTYTGSMATPAQTGGALGGGGDDAAFPGKSNIKNITPYSHQTLPGFGDDNPFDKKAAAAPPKKRLPPNKAPPELNSTAMMAAEADALDDDDDDFVKTYSEPWNDDPEPTNWNDEAMFSRPRDRSRAVQGTQEPAGSGKAGVPKKLSQLQPTQAAANRMDPDTPEPQSYDEEPQVSMDSIGVQENELKLRNKLTELQNRYDEVLLQVEELRLENGMLQKQNDALVQENKLYKHKANKVDHDTSKLQNAKVKAETDKNEMIKNTAQIAREIANIQKMFNAGTTRLQKINFDYLFKQHQTVESVTD
eukprot:1103241_1